MAISPTQTDAARNAQEIPAMDYAAHNATFSGFITLLKWSILASGITLVALYFFIEGQQPLVGTVLLLLIPVIVIAAMVMKSRRR